MGLKSIQILSIFLALVALHSLDVSATFISMGRSLAREAIKYNAKQEAPAAPSLGQIIGGKIDGIQNIKSMLLSPFLGLAQGLLGKGAPPAAAPAPAPAAAPAPAPAPSDGGGGDGYGGGATYAADPGYDQGSSYSSSGSSSNYGSGSYTGYSNSDYNNGLYGDTGKSDDFYAQDGYFLGTSKYDNFGRLTSTGGFDGTTKRDGLDIVVTGPYENYRSSSEFYNSGLYGGFGGPYGGGYGGGGGYRGHDGGYSGGRGGGHSSGHSGDKAKKSSAAKPQPATKGIGIGIGFQKNFQITWPSLGSKKAKSR